MQFTISDTTRGWIGGLISVASGAIGTAISTMIVAPQTFHSNKKGEIKNGRKNQSDIKSFK